MNYDENRLDYWRQRYPDLSGWYRRRPGWRRSSFLDRSQGYRPHLARALGFDVAVRHADCVPAARTLGIADPCPPSPPRPIRYAAPRHGARSRCRLSAARRSRLGAMKRA